MCKQPYVDPIGGKRSLTKYIVPSEVFFMIAGATHSENRACIVLDLHCVSIQDASLCAFITSPCLPATRPYALNMWMCCGYTRRRSERTHEGVLNRHTERGGGVGRVSVTHQHQRQHPHIAHQHHYRNHCTPTPTPQKHTTQHTNTTIPTHPTLSTLHTNTPTPTQVFFMQLQFSTFSN